MLIGDERHHHRSMVNLLPVQARVRLGLSATPEPYHTDESDPVSEYYGGIAG